MKKLFIASFIVLLAGAATVHYAYIVNNILLYEDRAVCDDDVADTPARYTAINNMNYTKDQNSTNDSQVNTSALFSSNLLFEIFAGAIGLLVLVAILVVLFG